MFDMAGVDRHQVIFRLHRAAEIIQKLDLALDIAQAVGAVLQIKRLIGEQRHDFEREFFAPLIGIVPLRRFPPRTILSRGDF